MTRGVSFYFSFIPKPFTRVFFVYTLGLLARNFLFFFLPLFFPVKIYRIFRAKRTLHEPYLTLQGTDQREK